MTLPWETTALLQPAGSPLERDTLDPVTLEVLWNAFKAIADMMGVTIWRTAYSTIVRDARDASAGLCDPRGRLVAQADLIPALAGIMHLSLKYILSNDIPLEEINEGDVIIMNHPYHAGTHTSDILLYSPIFVEGEIIGFAVSIAHHIDLGSMQATGITRATDLQQEGLLIPPLKLYIRGKLNQTLWQIIQANTRYPKDVLGDLRGQIAANNLGLREVHNLVDKYGKEVVAQAMSGVIEYGERMVRAQIERIPDGIYEAEGFLDDDGVEHGKPVKVKVRILVQGSTITYDFTDSDLQRRGNVNSPPAAIMTALGYVTKSISDTVLPENEGTFLAITPIFPRGSIVNPIEPAPVLMRHELVQRVADTLVKALARAVPEKICAGSAGNTCSFTIVSEDGIHYSNLGGGFGATEHHDGMSAIQVHLSKCMGVPVEDIELTSGTFIERFELRKDSGGPGRYRGGLGVRMDVRITSDEAVLSISSDAETSLPNGLFDGMPGLPGRKYLHPDSPLQTRLYAKTTNLRLPKDTVISLRTPGGGGYGNPIDREPEKILNDVLNGYVSHQSAFHDYGVVITEDGQIDFSATEVQRAELRKRKSGLPYAMTKFLEEEYPSVAS
jgi:N-methylhydantoinase B